MDLPKVLVKPVVEAITAVTSSRAGTTEDLISGADIVLELQRRHIRGVSPLGVLETVEYLQFRGCLRMRNMPRYRNEHDFTIFDIDWSCLQRFS